MSTLEKEILLTTQIPTLLVGHQSIKFTSLHQRLVGYYSVNDGRELPFYPVFNITYVAVPQTLWDKCLMRKRFVIQDIVLPYSISGVHNNRAKDFNIPLGHMLRMDNFAPLSDVLSYVTHDYNLG